MKKGERKRVNSGIVRLALQCNVSIVPAFVTRNTVTYGSPISYEKYADNAQDNELMQKLADELMDTIYSLGESK